MLYPRCRSHVNSGVCVLVCICYQFNHLQLDVQGLVTHYTWPLNACTMTVTYMSWSTDFDKTELINVSILLRSVSQHQGKNPDTRLTHLHFEKSISTLPFFLNLSYILCFTDYMKFISPYQLGLMLCIHKEHSSITSTFELDLYFMLCYDIFQFLKGFRSWYMTHI